MLVNIESSIRCLEVRYVVPGQSLGGGRVQLAAA